MSEIPNSIDLWLLAEAAMKNKHLTMSGRYVDCYSDTCVKDLKRRIDDAVHTRDLSSTRSDERIYYNGVLRVLRRRLREIERELRKREEASLNENRKPRDRLTNGRSASRLLKMSGLL